MSDPFEPTDLFESGIFGPYERDLFFVLATALVKVHLLIDLQSLRTIKSQFENLVPQEVLDLIKHYAVGDIVARNRTVLDREDNRGLMAELRVQIMQLCQWAKDHSLDKALGHRGGPLGPLYEELKNHISPNRMVSVHLGGMETTT